MKISSLNLFFVLLIISLIGNACADYALLWFTIERLDIHSSNSSSISSFYIGQAIGGILISQLISLVFDKYKKRSSSIILDSTYAIILIFVLIFFHFDKLNSIIILISTCLMSGISTVHKSAVGYALIQNISTKENLNKNTSNYTNSLAISQLLGASITGIIYTAIGFEGCLLLGIVSFIPIIYVYTKVFPRIESFENKDLNFRDVLEQFQNSYKFFLKDKLLLYTCISIALLNIVSSVIPSLIGISLKQSPYEESFYFTTVISMGIGLGVFSNRLIVSRVDTLNVRYIIPISLIPATLFILTSQFIEGPMPYILFFFAGCIGAALRNVTTGIIRIKRIPSSIIGRVNTLYSATLYLGQILGGFFIVPAFEVNIRNGTILVLIIFTITSLFSLKFLPKISLKEC